MATEADAIVAEAQQLATIAENVVIKVPIIREGLIAVKRLAALGIKTNVTVVCSPLQALLAAKCGATYVSPFVGRWDAMGHVGMDMIRQIKTIYDNYSFTTQIHRGVRAASAARARIGPGRRPHRARSRWR